MAMAAAVGSPVLHERSQSKPRVGRRADASPEPSPCARNAVKIVSYDGSLAPGSQLTRVQQVLQMPADAGVCRAAGAAPAAWANCTFYELPYAWTGQYFEGMFTSPLYYAQYFTEAWMFEYVSAVERVAW